jgi:hypothetical protein
MKARALLHGVRQVERRTRADVVDLPSVEIFRVVGALVAPIHPRPELLFDMRAKLFGRAP